MAFEITNLLIYLVSLCYAFNTAMYKIYKLISFNVLTSFSATLDRWTLPRRC